MMEWARWFESDQRLVEQATIGGLLVSTVFIGLGHVLFETMVFEASADVWSARATTRTQAMKNHSRALEWAKEKNAPLRDPETKDE